MAELDELIRWALSVDLPSTRAIGQHATGRVLVALATYANAECIAWPSTYTLEADISGLSRRDIRNALVALADAGLIHEVGRAGRAVKWQLSAGYPAYAEEAGYPAQERQPKPRRKAGGWAGTSAGEWAGESAGASAGYPAPNRKELDPIPTNCSPEVIFSPAPVDNSAELVDEEPSLTEAENRARQLAALQALMNA